MRSNSTLALTLCLISACQRPSAPAADTAASPPPSTPTSADSGMHADGALAGPIDQLGIHTVVVTPDTAAPGARRTTNFSFSLDDGTDRGLPVRVLLTDPEGRVTGQRPEWDAPRNEIPRAWYDRPAEPDSAAPEKLEVRPRIMIEDPALGRYRLELIGVRERRFYIDFRFEPAEGRAYGRGANNCRTSPGRVDTIWIDIWSDSTRLTGVCDEGP